MSATARRQMPATIAWQGNIRPLPANRATRGTSRRASTEELGSRTAACSSRRKNGASRLAFEGRMAEQAAIDMAPHGSIIRRGHQFGIKEVFRRVGRRRVVAKVDHRQAFFAAAAGTTNGQLPVRRERQIADVVPHPSIDFAERSIESTDSPKALYDAGYQFHSKQSASVSTEPELDLLAASPTTA